uniref:Reverse transcriptase zinc-binding domain-containing protein n=1 Tax=Lactuca sativa TaxID=4236 RepID=A0A9R1X2G6_LACSA|nr:hypothetical protein LSAT_V11C800412370 [Lactuca sativa]
MQDLLDCLGQSFTSKNNRGLGVGCLKTQNIVILTKWLWRLSLGERALWSETIKSIHNLTNKLKVTQSKKFLPSVWNNISKVLESYGNEVIKLHDIFSIHVGNGNSTMFWIDIWLGRATLQDKFPSLFSLESNKNCPLADRCPPGGTSWSLTSKLSGLRTIVELVILTSLVADVHLNNNPNKLHFFISIDGQF